MDTRPPGWHNVETIARAMCIVATQADCTVEEALALMERHAMVTRSTVQAIAVAVVDGSFSFDN